MIVPLSPRSLRSLSAPSLHITSFLDNCLHVADEFNDHRLHRHSLALDPGEINHRGVSVFLDRARGGAGHSTRTSTERCGTLVELP